MSDVEKGTSAPEASQGVNNGPGELWDPTRAYAPRQSSRIGNPGPLGLFSFASTTFILSLINVQARGVKEPNVVIGMALFTGGLAQILAGMWEFPRGNSFGATAFSSYGAFWMSYATILIPASGILDAYANAPHDLASALGIYLITWFMFTTLLCLGAIRRNIALTLLLVFLALTFLLLACAEFSGKVNVTKAGGGFGIVTAMIAYYCAVAELLVKEESYFMLPMGTIPKRSD